MRLVFLTVITISQLFGAIFALAFFDSALKQTPFSTLAPIQAFFVGTTILIYLFGLVGSILIWLSRRAGLYLSLMHQIALFPVVFVPGGFFWVMGDGLSLAAMARLTEAAMGFFVLFNFGSNSLLTTLSSAAGTSYYGADVFAVICAVYLNRRRRDGLFE